MTMTNKLRAKKIELMIQAAVETGEFVFVWGPLMNDEIGPCGCAKAAVAVASGVDVSNGYNNKRPYKAVVDSGLLSDVELRHIELGYEGWAEGRDGRSAYRNEHTDYGSPFYLLGQRLRETYRMYNGKPLF